MRDSTTMAYRGKFKPRNPGKYMGDASNIVYRSGWEAKLMGVLDAHPHVTRWGSEEVVIPYRSPIDGKIHRYFPDFYVEMIDNAGKKRKRLIEVKPKYQTSPPDMAKKMTPKGMISPRFLREVQTWGINQAKWKAAEEYCLDRQWSFVLMTEDELNIK